MSSLDEQEVRERFKRRRPLLSDSDLAIAIGHLWHAIRHEIRPPIRALSKFIYGLVS